jgi:hypothetical protein
VCEPPPPRTRETLWDTLGYLVGTFTPVIASEGESAISTDESEAPEKPGVDGRTASSDRDISLQPLYYPQHGPCQ